MVDFHALVSHSEDGRVFGQVLIRRMPWTPELSACARSRETVLAQLRAGLKWFFRNEGWLPQPLRWPEPELLRIAVDLKPGVEIKGRYFSADRNLRVEFPCIYGLLEEGLFHAFVPPLDLSFYFHDAGKLVETVRAEVQKALLGASPEAIAGLLPSLSDSLETIATRLPAARIRKDAPDEGSALEQVGEELTRRVLKRDHGAAHCREREVSDVIRTLGEKTPGLVLVGESGVGKTCILYEALRRMLRSPAAGSDAATGDDDDPTERTRFFATSGARIIAGMRWFGEWEERIRDVCVALASSDSVLIAGSLSGFLTAGRSGRSDRGLDVIVDPWLERGEVRMVFEATPGELDLAERLAPALVSRLKVLRIEEPSPNTCVRILEAILVEKCPGRDRAPAGVAESIHDLARRFQPRGAFPGKVTARARELAPVGPQAPDPSVEDVIADVSLVTGLPELFLDDRRRLAESTIRDFFAERLIGQPRAREAAVSLVAMVKAGLGDPGRPLASLLLSGPTGVGKTELAKCLAEFFFSGRERLIRLDMSEFALPGSTGRLIGDLRHGPGELTRRIQDQPFSVVLFDEVEKADPAVFDVLMGLFDEGRLTDPFGRVADFRSAILVLTSNLGASLGGSLGFTKDAAAAEEARTLKAVGEFFRPEFVNRLDRIVSFASLGPEQCVAIAERELAKLQRREGIARRGLTLEFAPGFAAAIARLGFDQRFGARPLKREIERRVTAPLARRLARDAALRDRTLRLDLDDAGALAVEGGSL